MYVYGDSVGFKGGGGGGFGGFTPPPPPPPRPKSQVHILTYVFQGYLMSRYGF